MDRNDVTRISELPENGNFSVGGSGGGQTRSRQGQDFGGRQDFGSRQGQGQDFGQSPTQYTPLNVHQNQFGIPPPTDTQLPTISVRGDNQMYSGGPPGPLGGSGGFSGESQYPSLPSMPNRGIPQDTTAFQNDEHMIPNHIPSTKLTHDYLREYETKLEKMSDQHQKEKHREDLVVSTYDEFQTPILIGVLFFLFQLPIINTLIFKHLGFLKIHNEDGNMNLYGMILKSVMFGLFYYGFIQVTTFI